jgi:uncharacterized membrane protein YgcG
MRVHALRTFAALAAFAGLTMQAARAADLPSYATDEETIHGTISSVSGSDLYLRDDRGFVDHVRLRSATVVNPNDLQLSSGQPVSISGHNGGSVFIASQIDAATSQSDAPAPAGDPGGYAYDPYPDAAYPYPYYGYGPYYYPGYYGPYYGASIGFFFGGGYNHVYYNHGNYGHGFPGHGYGGGFGGHGVVGHSVGGRSVSGGGGARASSGGRR